MVRNKQRDNLARVLRFPDGKLESPDFDSGYLGVDDKTPVVDLGIDDKTPVMGFDPNSITPISSIEYDEVERYMSRQPVLQRKDKNRKIEFDSDDKRKYFGLIGLLDVVRVELKNRRNKSFENITRNDKTIASVLETKLTAYSLITGSNSVSELCDWYSSISDLGDLAELKKVIYYKLESVISKCEDIDSLTDARVHILDLVNNSKGIIGMDLENLVKVLDQKIDYSIPLFTEELFYRMGRKEVVDKDFVESEGEKEFWEAFPLLDSGLNNMSDEDIDKIVEKLNKK